ncbi:MAG TPA: GNAT family N-acetyltransferase [Marmoricola sp.]
MTSTARKVRATGPEAVALATALLQRVRLADPLAGMWEAADVQWWWRKPKPTDDVDQLFWLDEDGPVAGVLLTGPEGDAWQCDPIVVPGATGCSPQFVWDQALEHAGAQAPDGFDVPVSDGGTFAGIAQRSDLVPDYQDSTGWLAIVDRPPVRAFADGFSLHDRTERLDLPHHMHGRSGPEVERRLQQTSLYDPALDLVVETDDGRVAGYTLHWFDPTTKVGLIEPVRVEDEFQRRGLASAMLTHGIERLAAKGAERVKISYGSEAAGRTYTGVGFRPTSTATWYGSSAG